MKKILNTTHFEGYLWGHDLQIKVTKAAAKNPGVEFISGTVQILTDEDGLNIVPINYRYVVEKTKAGKDNLTYKSLFNIMNSTNATYQDVGVAAMKLRADTTIGLNDFYNQENELISYKINDGGFIHILTSGQTFGSERNRFEVDMLITGTQLKEADEEHDKPAMVVVKGATFNFMGSLLPIELVVKNDGGRQYFEDLGATTSEPVFMKVWGKVVSTTVETETSEESAFGGPSVKITTRNIREWEITGAAATPYDFGVDGVLTDAEVKEAMGKRETFLADTKTSHDTWMKNKNATAANATPTGVPAGTPQTSATGKPYVF